MDITPQDRFDERFSDKAGRVLCYLLGPLAGAVVLHFRQYGNAWSIRFHVFHSMLMAAVWAITFGTLRLIESISPWFLSMLARQLRFAANLGFVLVWAILLATAYRGGRCAVIPWVHGLAVRLARKSEKHPQPLPAEA